MAKAAKICLTETFTPTKWDSAETKLSFANHLMNFIATDFPEAKFTDRFYRRLSMTFGFIAHCDRGTFFATYFTRTQDKLRFLNSLLEWGCFGSPEYTYCDVERAVKTQVREYDFIGQCRARLARETEASDLALLATLQAKYSVADNSVPSPQSAEWTPQIASPVSISTGPKPQNDKAPEQLGLFAA